MLATVVWGLWASSYLSHAQLESLRASARIQLGGADLSMNWISDVDFLQVSFRHPPRSTRASMCGRVVNTE